jgi:hypothetical protein
VTYADLLEQVELGNAPPIGGRRYPDGTTCFEPSDDPSWRPGDLGTLILMGTNGALAGWTTEIIGGAKPSPYRN